jgi:hypothetical protein
MENRFDEGGVGIGTDESGIRLAADEHDHRVEDDGFARACFTRKDDETRIEAQVEFIDNGEVLDVKFG